MDEKRRCDCGFCISNRKEKWDKIMKCGCCCHDWDGETGHDKLCCSTPNALKKNNPFLASLPITEPIKSK